MLKRLYVDNFRCLVNFELKLDRQQLILGSNGSGKSTVLEVLSGIKALLNGSGRPANLFPESARTKWQTLPAQTFELDVKLESEYRFILEVDSRETPARTRVRRELVLCDNKPVFEFIEGEVKLYNDRYEHKVTYPFDWFRSALATIQGRPETTRLNAFKKWVEDLHCLRCNPDAMASGSDGDEFSLASDMSNFASWYRHVSQERADAAAALQSCLREVVAGFKSLDLRSKGSTVRALSARFGSPAGERFEIPFEDLSQGERVLVCLYAVLHFLIQEGACIFLDEPENYLALAEIQPWLVELTDRIQESRGQVCIISHHPELIDYLAPDCGIIFERKDTGPVRVRPFDRDLVDALSPSEQVARGWLGNGSEGR